MTAFEAFLAFLVVAGVLSIPLLAIITRTSSPIGQALAERIRRKTDRRFPPSTQGDPPLRLDDLKAQIAEQQREIAELSSQLEFVQRLLEEPRERG